MKVLILGGTQFVGRHLVEALVEKGHDVTLFHRGITGKNVFPHLKSLIGDRNESFAALEGGTWDVCVDMCAYVPRHITTAAEALKDKVQRLVFISTISVYAPPFEQHPDEHHARQILEDPSTEDYKTHYGALKVACEDKVNELWGDRAWTVRPGIICGPYDHTHRFTYWAFKIGRGQPFLAPSNLAQPFQALDARDLAQFLVAGIEQSFSGVHNVVGSDQTFESVFQAASGHWESLPVPGNQDIDQKLPMVLPTEAYPLFQVNCDKARKAGFVNRPIVSTITDILEYEMGLGQALKAGLSPDEEAFLLGQLSEKLR